MLSKHHRMAQDPALTGQGIPPPPPGASSTGGQGKAMNPPPSSGPGQPATQQPLPVSGGSTGQAPVVEESFLRPRPPDDQLGIGFVGDYKTSVAIPAHPNTTFNEPYFLKMLSGSISLTKNEKKKIVEAIPKLSQYQIDELIKIFEEERRKFAELDEKHQVKIRELQQKQTDDWRDLEMEKQQVQQKSADEDAAKALREKLMGKSGEKPVP